MLTRNGQAWDAGAADEAVGDEAVGDAQRAGGEAGGEEAAGAPRRSGPPRPGTEVCGRPQSPERPGPGREVLLPLAPGAALPPRGADPRAVGRRRPPLPRSGCIGAGAAIDRLRAIGSGGFGSANLAEFSRSAAPMEDRSSMAALRRRTAAAGALGLAALGVG